MPNRLHRYYGAGYLHFITTSCYQRRALLGRRAHRDLFLQVLEQVRKRYGFIVVGYVVMPEHVHLLIGEPERANPSVVMQALKQSFARRLQRKLRGHDNPRQGSLWNAALVEGHIWQRRFYDFVVFGLRNCATCIAIRSRADSCSNRSNGRGAAFATTLAMSVARCW
jgi:putative transposase